VCVLSDEANLPSINSNDSNKQLTRAHERSLSFSLCVDIQMLRISTTRILSPVFIICARIASVCLSLSRLTSNHLKSLSFSLALCGQNKSSLSIFYLYVRCCVSSTTTHKYNSTRIKFHLSSMTIVLLPQATLCCVFHGHCSDA
jgi:hypothetical protein